MTIDELELIADDESPEVFHAIQLRNPTNEQLLAIEALVTGTPPMSAIKKLPGKGSYLSHVWVTKQLNRAFGIFWNWEILETGVDPNDGSAHALGRLTIQIPLREGKTWTRVITEVGSFETYPKKDPNGKPLFNADGTPQWQMVASDRIASAASRALVKAVARAFNLGLDLEGKDTEDILSPVEAWNRLITLGKRFGMTKEEVADILKGKFKGDELADKFAEAYAEVRKAGKEKQMPEKELPNL
jgi:hypothetical protein